MAARQWVTELMLGMGANLDLPTVLLIDDDMVSREVMATILTMSGYALHTAADGAAALQILDKGQCLPQVILMDAQMPGLSGLLLVEQLRTRTSARVYAISGSSTPADLLAAVDGFLLKPFGPQALQELLEKNAPVPAAPAPEPDEPVVNPQTLAQFRQMMPESMVREIYTAVTTDLEKRTAALESALARGDSAEIHRIGHAIKGGCGMAGALQAARLGARLESGSDQLDNCTAVLSDLRDAVHNLESMLKLEFLA